MGPDAFEAVGGFNEAVMAAEDADLNFRLKAAGGGLERRESGCASRTSARCVNYAALLGAASPG